MHEQICWDLGIFTFIIFVLGASKTFVHVYNFCTFQFEREKTQNGQMVSNNRELSMKLDSLKQDLIEYEERYERCKADNEKAVKQLELLS